MKSTKFITKPIFLVKLSFFIVYAAGSVLLPFIALYYEQRGFSGREIGLLASISPIMTMVGTAVWGGLADAIQRHKQLFILAIAGSIVSVALIPVAQSFLVLSLVIALHAFCFMSLIPLYDNSALEILGDHSEKYGQIRLWGSIGWGVGAPLIGPLVEQLGLEWTFYGHAGLMLVGLLIALPLPVARSAGGGFGSGLRSLFQDSRWYLFLLIIFVAGFGDAVIRNYGFLYLKDLGTSSVLMGLSLTIGTVSELVVLANSGSLLRSLGARKLLVVSVLAQIFRLLAWSFISHPYVALSMHLLNGLTFGALWIAGVAYAKEIAPAGMTATAQGLLSSIYFGLASVVGAMAGGLLYEQVGSWDMFRWTGIAMIVGLLSYSLANVTAVKPAAEQPVKLS
jgi:PPP family 3-phenylpropionic acid transporter